MSKVRSALALVAAALLASTAHAQLCPDPGNTHYQNDILPQVPGGALNIAIVPGLCEGEGCAAVFDIAGATPEKITQVACPFTSPSGTGLGATVNVQIFDNVTFNAQNVVTMGTKVFDLVNATGNEALLAEGGINTIDLSNYNIQVTGPKFAVAFIMNFNPNGNCTTGFTSNFFTDNTPCVARKNLLYILGTGWVDSTKAKVGPINLCPLFYNGNWVIRCCTEPILNPVNVTVIGSPVLPGQFVNLIFNAPGYAGSFYAAGVALGTNPGLPVPPLGTLPLNYDVLMQWHLSTLGGGVFNNFFAFIGPAGTAPGLVLMPPQAQAGLEIYVAFVVFDVNAGFAPIAVSSASKIVVQ
ncbi:MAG: hypothetical protein R3F34_04200 [Planctomycetota bacterium]